MTELEPGRLIQSRYRLDAEIGRGGFGTVWRATQLGVERTVAIKFLRTDLSPDAGLRFEREARALGLLNHPGCVTLHDFGITEEGQPFLVTEFVHGESLYTWRRRERSLDEILDVARQLSAALAHAHRYQLVHRDLKPANVMVTRDDTGAMRVKVLDFGVARVAGDRWPDITKTGVVVGTPGYISPEQLIGAELSPKTDLYALGVLLFELIEGGPPFRAESSLKLAMRHIKEDAPRLTRGPEPLRDLVASLLSRHPDDRPLGARHVHEALQGIHAGSGDRTAAGALFGDDAITVKQPVTPAETEPAASTTRSSLALTALVLLALVAGAGFAMTLLDAGNEEPAKQGGLSKVLEVPQKKSRRPEPQLPSPVSEPDAASNPPTAGSRSSSGCGSPFTARGATEVVSMVGLESRSVDVFVPAGYDPDTPRPAVIVLHDGFESSTDLVVGKGFGARADATGVILILPRDERLRSPWRGGDTVRQAKADVELVLSQLCVDPDQLYVFGNGAAGTAVDELICDVDIAAAAVAAHRFKPAERMCAGALVPYLIFHQLEGFDPPDGGRDCLGERRVSIAEHDARLVDRNRCEKRRRVWERKGSSCFTWSCEVDLVSCQVAGGRPWHGKPRIPCEGKPADFPYLDVLWGFFFDRDAMFSNLDR